jgi:hypothetical protein
MPRGRQTHTDGDPRGDEPEGVETVTEDQKRAADGGDEPEETPPEETPEEETPTPRERPDADDVEAEQGDAEGQARRSARGPEDERPEGERGEPQSAGRLQTEEQREADDERAARNRESTTAILESQGMTYEEGQRRLTRERGYADDLPMVSHTQAWETGYAGQVPDRTPNEAYQAGGDEEEAARADLRAASRGRLGND